MRVRLPAGFLTTPIAHRGLHDVQAGRPENSRASVRAAIADGYGIEIDIQPSSDGAAMVFHDYDLPRLTGHAGKTTDFDADALAQMPLLDGEGETIPRLRDVLQLVAGQVPLLIEIKDQDGEMGPRGGALDAAVAEDLKDYDGPVALMSFNPHSVLRLRDLLPKRPRGLVTCGFRTSDWALPEPVCARLREIPDFERAECSFISHQWSDLSRPRVAELRADGHAVLCWTIKSPAEEAEARRMAQNITFEQYRAPHPS